MIEYELSLSAMDFKKMSQELLKLDKKLETVKELILKELAQYTQERIIYYIAISVGNTDYVGTDELINSIVISDIFEDTIRVFTDNAYAVFVEYGTGVKGANIPHPNLPNSVTAYGKTYSSYNENLGGQVAHKFMFNAFQDLQENYLNIVESVLKKEGIV